MKTVNLKFDCLFFIRKNCIVVALLWSSLLSYANGQIDHELLSRFKEEAPIAWKECDTRRKDQRYHEHFWNVSIEEFVKLSGEENTLNLESVVIHKRLGTEKENVLDRFIHYTRGFDRLDGMNRGYTFQLERPNKDHAWQLVALDPRRPEEVKLNERDTASNESEIHRRSASGFPLWSNTPTVQWLELPELSFQRVAAVEYEGKSCVEIEITFIEPEKFFYTGKVGGQYDENSWKFARATHFCTVIFSPSEFWLVRSIDGYLSGNPRDKNEKEKYLFTRKYDHVLTGVPHMTLEESFYGNSRYSETPSRRSICRYGKKPPLDEFRVSTYGFPEPDWYTPPLNWNRLLVILALTVIGISLALAFLKLLIKRK